MHIHACAHTELACRGRLSSKPVLRARVDPRALTRRPPRLQAACRTAQPQGDLAAADPGSRAHGLHGPLCRLRKQQAGWGSPLCWGGGPAWLRDTKCPFTGNINSERG